MTREEKKRNARWWVLALALYLATVGSAILAAQARINGITAAADDAVRAMQTAFGERDNARELARQWERQYNEALMEIAALKSENEELTRRWEEASFALDEVVEETGWTSLGEFRITHYCNCEKCCGKWANGRTATGTTPTEGRTIAVDPAVIPLGSEVRLNGHIYVAEDTGVHGKAIDVYVDDHGEALRLGLYRAEVEKKTGR